MGLTIGRQDATERFAQALVLARSSMELPEEWLDRTRIVGNAQNKTFTPVLGTALLAKATDRFVDAFSLREGESHKSYSARSVAKEILVPCCVRAGIDIRNKGAEPLNNQPFLRAMRIAPDLKVKANAVDELKYLCECLEQVDFLEDRAALEALAAFLRTRIAASKHKVSVDLGAGVLELLPLAEALDQFVAGESEGGKVGQAVTTAILDLVFNDVRTKKINDPSSKWPGDVGAFDHGVQILSVEVKQRLMTDAEVLIFAKRLQEAEVKRGFVLTITRGANPLDVEQLRFQAHRLYGSELFFFKSAGSLLRAACAMAPQDLLLSLAAFPRYVLARMAELETSDLRIKEWAGIFDVARVTTYSPLANDGRDDAGE